MLLCILATASCVFAQTAFTSLRGTVKDPSGALVPGTTITLTAAATGQTFTATANTAGEYVFAQIPPARYTITASSAGFASQSKTAELLVNQPATINFTLTVQSTNVTVDVSAAAETLNTNDASLGNAMGNQMIQAIPTETRNVPDLLALQPGVLYLPNTTTDSRSGAVNGGRSDQGNITIDGIDDNDQVNGYAFTGVLRQTQDSIEEFRVVTGNSNADSGRSSGAQVSMVTKSGTNRFHGAAYEYNRPTFTVANDWFNKQAQLSSGEPNIPGKLIRNIFGADLGGPIKKDKLFFFVNYEGKRQAENEQVTRTVPTHLYQQGVLQYTDTSGAVQQISQSDFAALDSGCQICNTSAYPNGPGGNPNALAYFNSMPMANGTTEGDGLNTGSYSFSSPNPVDWDTYIAKIDYTPSEKHHIFVRGQLQKDTQQYAEQFPGQGPASTEEDNNRGLMGGDTWTITPNLINDIRYGFIRQGTGVSGVGKGDYVDFRFMDTTTAETRNTITTIPVNNIVDNLSWIKGNHTLQFGVNWRLIHQNHSTDANSFNNASTNPYWLGGNPPEPADAVSSGFSNSYEIAFANLVGTVPSLTNVYNYAITSPTAGTALADGAVIDRHFKANEFEGYIQDAWRIQPNLTMTFGVRYTYLQTPWETKGQEVAPTIDTHTWYLQREAAAQQGQIYEPDLQFSPAGHYYNKPGFFPANKANFAPRFAIAYSPDGKTSIRAGAGLYYDHFGESLVNIFDQEGSFGMSSSVTNPAGVYGIEGNDGTHLPSPRFMGRNVLPPIDNGPAESTQTFPYTAPLDNFAITWGMDSKIKTPYSETFDFSIQRELPSGFTLEAAYTGRLGRHLLQSLDLAEPVDYVDPQGGGDYYAAGTQLSKDVDQRGGAYGGWAAYDSTTGVEPPPVHVPTIPYFEDLFPFMAGYDEPGESATDAIYNNEWAPYRAQYGATTSLSDIDFYCYYGCPAGWQSHFWQDQFSSLYALSSIGMSYYHAAQLTLRHPMSHGLQMDFSYTFSKSIDMGSDAERNNEFTGANFGGQYSVSDILNTWKPYLNRAVSDFDTRHLITTDYLYLLPFGRGKWIGGNSSALLDNIIGGWELSGALHWSSGLPFSFYEPGWTTDWQIESYGVETQKIKMRRHLDQNGNPQFFDDPDAINNGIATGSPERLPYPGEAGQRNNFRGDGYFDLSSGLAKSWNTGDFGKIKFAWEVYNVTNSVRFDPLSIGSGLTGGNLGVASKLLTQPRRMQFSLRYDF